MAKKSPAFKARATEASDMIERLSGRLSYAQIAERCRVSERSVYRWAREGRAPHPLILDGLRRLLEQEGV